jgi:hypothetical protein
MATEIYFVGGRERVVVEEEPDAVANMLESAGGPIPFTDVNAGHDIYIAPNAVAYFVKFGGAG